MRKRLGVLLLLAACGGGGSDTAAVFLGQFWVVDRSDLYDPSLNLLSNGGFENGMADWQVVLAGSPSASVVPRDSGSALRVTTLTPSDQVTLASPAFSVPSGVERFYVAFEARTDFGILDEGWSGAGSEESPAPDTEIAVTGILRWTMAEGGTLEVTVQRVLHSLDRWRPHLSEAAVPADATTVQARFFVLGNVPNESLEPHETFLDNVRLFPEPPSLAPRQVQGTARIAEGGAVAFSGSTQEFSVDATASADGRVVGNVVNLLANSVAMDLLYSVEVDAARVDYDISRSVSVDAGRYYADPISADWYSDLTMSPVPLGSVTSASGVTTGLAIGLDRVRVVLFRYDALWKRLEALHRFGLHAGGSASFTIYRLQTDSPWGYRELWRRYVTEFEPIVSSVPRPAPGGTGAFFPAVFDTTQPGMPSFYPEVDGMIQDFGLRFVLDRLGSIPSTPAQFFEHLETYDLEAVNYDYPWILETEAGEADLPPPSYADAEAAVTALTLGIPTATFGKLKQIQAKEALRDARGGLVVNRNWAPPFSAGKWLLRIPVELRPDLSPYLETAMSQKYLPTFADQPRIVGAYFDGFLKESKVLEGSVADSPLTYDPNTGQPMAHLIDRHWAYLREIRSRFDAAGYPEKTLWGNLTASGPAMFAMPGLDVAGWEASPTTGANFDHRELNLRRMMLPGKPMAVIFKGEWWNFPGHQDALRRFFETAALLGLYPNIIESHVPPPPLMDATQQGWYRALYREAIPVLDAMHEGGWQVIPHARIESVGGDAAALRVERFGRGHFAVLNNPSGILNDPTASVQTVRLTVDLAALGLQGAAQVSFGEVAIASATIEPDGLVLTFELPAGRGAVFRVE